MSEAYKKRDMDAIRERAKKFIRFNTFRQKLRSRKQYRPAHKDRFFFIIYPCIDSVDVLADVVNRLSFALPQKEGLSIYVAVSNALRVDSIFELPTPEFQERYIGRNENIYFVDEETAKGHLKDDFVLLYDVNALKKLSVLREAYKLEIIDKTYFSDKEAESLRHLFFSVFSLEEKRRFLEISKKNFQVMKDRNSGKKNAYCFTTGPSFDRYEDFYFEENSFKVICNSIVKNKAFLSYINGADLLVFADPVFHFGPSSYAEQFRQDVMHFIDKYDAYVLVPDYNMPLLLAHYPQLEARLIGMPGQKKFNFPMEKDFFVKGSANILTLYMLPIASAVSEKIGIIGADGRKEGEKYFWKHSASAQYDDKMEGVFKTHPSFFRDRDYKDYYAEHCRFLEELISYGEGKGKCYYSITPSYIPALKKRFGYQASSNIAFRSQKITEMLSQDMESKINSKKRNESTNEPRFLFILTPPFSGSTLLAKILNTSKNTMLLHEKGEGQWLIPQMCEPDRWKPEKKIDWKVVKLVWLNQYKRVFSQENHTALIVEKSPPNIVRAEQIFKHFNNAVFMAFNRNPYANCSSILHRNYVVEKLSKEKRIAILENLARLWIFRSRHIRSFIEVHNIYYFTYEAFCEQPIKCINGLIEICPELKDVNVNAHVKVKDYKAQGIVNQNPRQIEWLDQDEIAVISSVLSAEEALLKFFGYSLLE
jgi:hypothetical protein